MLINCFISICILANQPFIDRIQPDSLIQKSYVLLDRKDREKYIVYNERYKVSDPGKFTFLNFRVEFLAFEKDSLNDISSVMLYFNTTEDVMESFKKEFGTPTSDFSVRGEFNKAESPYQYTSYAWTETNYVMLMSVVTSSPKENLIRVWIKKRA